MVKTMTKTNVKMTEVKALETALALNEVKANKELSEKFATMLAVRKGKGSKVTPKQLENKKIAETVVGILRENAKPMTVTEVTEIVKGGDWKEPVNPQRISRIMTNLKEEGQIHREMERKVAVFFVR